MKTELFKHNSRVLYSIQLAGRKQDTFWLRDSCGNNNNNNTKMLLNCFLQGFIVIDVHFFGELIGLIPLENNEWEHFFLVSYSLLHLFRAQSPLVCPNCFWLLLCDGTSGSVCSQWAPVLQVSSRASSCLEAMTLVEDELVNTLIL